MITITACAALSTDPMTIGSVSNDNARRGPYRRCDPTTVRMDLMGRFVRGCHLIEADDDAPQPLVNLVGDVTPGSVYAHIDQSLGPWKQRPVFKTNVKNFVCLRKVKPPIPTDDLRRLVEFFPSPSFKFPLDPTFEPEVTGRPAGAPGPKPENTARFAVLQKYNRVNLVVPVDAQHMWHAAMESKHCKLTVFGEHYRRLVEQGLI